MSVWSLGRDLGSGPKGVEKRKTKLESCWEAEISSIIFSGRLGVQRRGGWDGMDKRSDAPPSQSQLPSVIVISSISLHSA